MTLSNGNIYRFTGPLRGESTGTRGLPLQMQVTRRFDVFSDLRLNNDWANNRDAGDLRRHRSHYDAAVMILGEPGYSWLVMPWLLSSTAHQSLWLHRINVLLFPLQIISHIFAKLDTK